jgi:hypothetical protein
MKPVDFTARFGYLGAAEVQRPSLSPMRAATKAT